MTPQETTTEDLDPRPTALPGPQKRNPNQTLCACGKPVGSAVGDGVCIDCRFAYLEEDPESQTSA